MGVYHPPSKQQGLRSREAKALGLGFPASRTMSIQYLLVSSYLLKEFCYGSQKGLRFLKVNTENVACTTCHSHAIWDVLGKRLCGITFYLKLRFCTVNLPLTVTQDRVKFF
jgi:hypothetical protein